MKKTSLTKEEKQLLLNDLCGRIPHGVKVNNEIQGDFNIYGICENLVFGRNEVCHIDFNIENIKPYLFPLSSMTEEQESDLNLYLRLDKEPIMRSVKEIDWYNKNHFDIHGLIPLGLAIDCTNLNIY